MKHWDDTLWLADVENKEKNSRQSIANNDLRGQPSVFLIHPGENWESKAPYLASLGDLIENLGEKKKKKRPYQQLKKNEDSLIGRRLGSCVELLEGV